MHPAHNTQTSSASILLEAKCCALQAQGHRPVRPLLPRLWPSTLPALGVPEPGELIRQFAGEPTCLDITGGSQPALFTRSPSPSPVIHT